MAPAPPRAIEPLVSDLDPARRASDHDLRSRRPAGPNHAGAQLQIPAPDLHARGSEDQATRRPPGVASSIRDGAAAEARPTLHCDRTAEEDAPDLRRLSSIPSDENKLLGEEV